MRREVVAEQLTQLGLAVSEARDMASRVETCIASLPAENCWRKVSREILTPAHPFAVHGFLYETVYADWDRARRPAPAWIPPDDFVPTTNIARLMREINLKSYGELRAWSVRERAGFWDVMVHRLGIRFKQPYARVMDTSRSAVSPEWFPDARLNIADSCFQTSDDAPAVVYRPAEDRLSALTYRELEALVNRVANALADRGFEPGDAVAIDLPMTVEAVAVYLGIVKAGCVVVSIADSFAPEEIAKRLRLADARAVFTQDFIPYGRKRLPLYDKVVAAKAPGRSSSPVGRRCPVSCATAT